MAWNDEMTQRVKKEIFNLLCQGGMVEDTKGIIADDIDLSPLSGDGSSRHFFRVYMHRKSLCLAVFPETTRENDLAEARSAHTIGSHLRAQGGAVPRQFGYDEESGLLFFEDLGDRQLYDVVTGTDIHLSDERERIVSLYERVIHELVTLQLKGATGFDTRWCWDSPRYDEELMVTRESGYFLQAFWQGLLTHDIEDDVVAELHTIAARVDLSQPYFLHRDFQSRNIMLRDNDSPVIIDFQGGRLGPLGYDIASLLLDPYVALPQELQEHLLHVYMQCVAKQIPLDEELFLHQYRLLALQRNLQIIGAFSFLSRVKNKPFFTPFILPSVQMLHQRLCDPQFVSVPHLRDLVDTALNTLEK